LNNLVITNDHIESAIEIARALIPHANHAFLPSGLQCHETAKKIIEWTQKNLRVVFQKREFQIDHSYIDKNTIEPALDRLISLNYLRKIRGPKNSPVYIVNPRIVDPNNLPLEIRNHPILFR
jgi:hypothetical protein